MIVYPKGEASRVSVLPLSNDIAVQKHTKQLYTNPTGFLKKRVRTFFRLTIQLENSFLLNAP